MPVQHLLHQHPVPLALLLALHLQLLRLGLRLRKLALHCHQRQPVRVCSLARLKARLLALALQLPRMIRCGALHRVDCVSGCLLVSGEAAAQGVERSLVGEGRTKAADFM